MMLLCATLLNQKQTQKSSFFLTSASQCTVPETDQACPESVDHHQEGTASWAWALLHKRSTWALTIMVEILQFVDLTSEISKRAMWHCLHGYCCFNMRSSMDLKCPLVHLRRKMSKVMGSMDHKKSLGKSVCQLFHWFQSIKETQWTPKKELSPTQT